MYFSGECHHSTEFELKRAKVRLHDGTLNFGQATASYRLTFLLHVSSLKSQLLLSREFE